MLKDFIPRLYQQTILGTAAQFNTLVVLPTGMGKTALALLLAVQRFHHYPQSKVLMLAPTKPLCEQHIESFRKYLTLDAQQIILFTGDVSPEKRAELWKSAKVVVSTPQGLENDVINRRVRLEEVSLLVFDESHHATGDYAYVWLAQQYEKACRYPRILGLTASPGSDLQTIQDVCTNLHIERVEVRTEDDPDVRPYVQDITLRWESVQLPAEFKKIQELLRNALKAKYLELQKLGTARSSDLTKGELLGLQKELQQKLHGGERDFEILRSLSLVAEALKIDHAVELLETQGIQQVHSYFSKLREEGKNSTVKAVKNLLLDESVKAAMFLAEELVGQGVVHPKMQKVVESVSALVQEKKEAKVIVFTQFRDTAQDLVKRLSSSMVTAHIFVGQAKKKGIGFSQKQQKEVLDKFRAGEFQVLVATSVAEEGLDIPKVEHVFFYEPIPSAIRSIQRKGRTGRLEEGSVTIFLTKGTRDEAYRWSAHHKEKRMYRHLRELKKNLILQPQSVNNTLEKFIPQDTIVTVLADHREKDNKVVKELVELGVSVQTAQLTVADYVVAGTVGVELKKVGDFVNSLVDGRLLEQVSHLHDQFPKAVLVIEGEEDIYGIRNVHPNAIRGLLASIVLDFRVPVLYTKNPKDTAALLAVMAKREQNRGRDVSLHEKKPQSFIEQIEFAVSSFPGIGVVHARNLLSKFRSLRRLVSATSAELKEVEGVGGKTAEKLVQFFEEEYKRE
ncbi:TPA: DEAD/DEAH box helicase [Candidatus Woesearchaeota archaeon]|nr:DEAD/DEAH box helicase [Candidatus Woesearchaeota archaeon]